ncbi:unnamed protein product [Angiostrongylus costaricensis]|uniref:DUF3361 domain-containing protein n=1 Tax=Angiostrongylus costaricensis TaxID=334426 RepID=A0A0R3PJ56_ANGCS|nr:unnamed protein product [Angiostrongylus costaricensis]
MSTFIVIDKKVRFVGLSSYGLIFEEPKGFLTPTNLDRVNHGFMLTVTAGAKHYVEHINCTLASRTDFDSMERALIDELLFQDPYFVACFCSLSSIQLLYDLLADENIESQSCLNLCLRSLRSILQLEVNGITWSSASAILVSKLATLVTGRAKREDSNVVLIALNMIEQLLVNGSTTIRSLVLDEVPPQSLIRHLEKSDERVALAALSLMNALHDKSDEPSREQIHLDSVPFRTAISGTVLREGRGCDAVLLSHLVPLERLLIQEHTKQLRSPVLENEVNMLLVSFSMHLVQISMIGSLRNYFRLVSENSMRVSGAAWQLIPVWFHCISIVATILGVIPNGKGFSTLKVVTFETFDSLFATTVQLFHRTWREMHASRDEHEKVHSSLYTVIFFSKIRFALKAMQPHDVVSLFLLHVLFSELRNLLKPSIEQLIRINRKNILKQGFTFRRQVKGKTPHKGEGENISFLILLELYISLHKRLAVKLHVFPSN